MNISYCSESIHAQIFNRLLDVIPDLHAIDDVGLSEVKGMLPLHFDVVFSVEGELPPDPAWVDAAQFEQALLNLLKNAHESGSKPEDVGLQVRRVQDQLRIDVLDRGSGMSEAVLTQALVPFYSTKRSGTGLGLALAREIAEAHGGRILLANRDGGGLAVTLFLPALSAPPSG